MYWQNPTMRVRPNPSSRQMVVNAIKVHKQNYLAEIREIESSVKLAKLCKTFVIAECKDCISEITRSSEIIFAKHEIQV